MAKHRAFFDGLTNIKCIITYGHSMANVDWSYFVEVIKILCVDVPWRMSCFSANDVSNIGSFQTHFGLTEIEIIEREEIL